MNLHAVIPFVKPYRTTLALALSALVAAAAVLLAMPAAVGRSVDAVLAAGDSARLDSYFGLLLLLVVLAALASALRFYLVMWLGERIVADIRCAVFGHVLTLEPAFFETTPAAAVLSRLNTDTTLVQAVVGAGFSIALRSAFMLMGGMIMLAVTSPALTGLILVLVPLVLGPILILGRKVRRLARTTQDRVAETAAVAGETFNAMAVIQAFTLEGVQRQRYRGAVEAAFASARQRLRARAVLTAAAVMIVFGAVMAVLWMGAERVLEGRMSAGDLSRFLLYALMVAVSAAGLAEVWGEVQRAAGAMERLLALLKTRPTIVVPPDPVGLAAAGADSIHFDQVRFAYPSRPDDAALVDFSLTIEPGETVALVGPSGAGKSTVFQLLLRFYDPQAGRIVLGGVDIARADPRVLRQRIGIVPQETVIFAADAMENIRCGRPGASDEAVYAAARAAHADEFIRRLPQGYRSFLGERGIRLSGGQQQRLAIARALLKDAPILLLDEATSALDAESETRIQAAFAELMAGRTTLVIAHRLATVRAADRIVVMDQGRIVALGRHPALLRQGGLYARLAALQFGAVGAARGAGGQPH